jgi:bacillithiol system protein YtxJ
MNWNPLTTIDQLNLIDQESAQQPVMILKHSTRCSISSAALARLERNWDNKADMKVYYLDLIAYRNVSNEIASRYGIEHQSPQVIVIKNGRAVYAESHMGIQADEIIEQVLRGE